MRAAAPPLTAPKLGPGSTPGQLDGEFVSAEFDWAFVDHAPLEPNSAVADVREDSAEIWSELKTPIIAQATIAEAVGLPVEKVTVHVVRGGGSFGRRLFFDGAPEAAQISKALRRPVKLMWSSADDMQHGRMRPRAYSRHRFTHAGGQILGYEERVCNVETDRRNPRVYKAVMAFDAGLPINPRGLEAQMLSGLNDGISTVLYAGNHLDNGVFRETSYTDFGYAKQRHYPTNVEMYVMHKTADEPGGAGETIVSAAGGAVANAYARATGTKPRSFPINF
ncbi:MAG: molybdopterin cofactor-binding domain-containing protein [Pseudonocardiaceae bacterium]